MGATQGAQEGVIVSIILHYKGDQWAQPGPCWSPPIPPSQRIGVFAPGRGDRSYQFGEGSPVMELWCFEVEGTTQVRDAIEVTGAERGFIMLANDVGELEMKLARARGNGLAM